MSFVTPIKHTIPNTNNYKNVNITNFTGTNCSENLFDKKSSGCLESENVYVNEENILAVRPRLEHEAFFENVKEVLKVEILKQDLMLYHVKQSDPEKECIILSDKKQAGQQDDDKILTLDVDDSLGDASFFLDGEGRIICTSEKGLYHIKELDDSLELVKIDYENPDVYVPTVRQGMTFGIETSGIETLEPVNLLADKYYRTYNYNLNSLDNITAEYLQNRKFKVDDIFKLEDLEQREFMSNSVSDMNQTIELIDSKNLFGPRVKMTVQSENCYLYFGYNETYPETPTKTFGGSVQLGNITFSDSPNNGVYNGSGSICLTKISTIVIGDTLYNIHSLQIAYNQSTKHADIQIHGTKIINGAVDDITFHYLAYLDTADADFFNNVVTQQDKTCTLSLALVKVSDDELGCVVALERNAEDKRFLINTFPIDSLTNSNYYKHITNPLLSIPNSDEWGLIEDIVVYRNNINILWKTRSELILLKTNILSLETTIVRTNISGLTIATTTKDGRFKLLPTKDDSYYIFFSPDDILQEGSNILTSAGKINWLNKNSVLSKTSQIIYVNGKTGEITAWNNELFEKATIYQIPETRTLLLFKDNNIYFATNYISQDSGIFKYEENIIAIDDVEDLEYDILFENSEFILQLLIKTIYPHDGSFVSVTNLLKLIIQISEPGFITEIVDNNDAKKYIHDFKSVKMFDNRFWFFDSAEHKNELRWSFNTKLWYIPQDNHTFVGKQEPITDLLALSTTQLGIFQKDSTSIITADSTGAYRLLYTLKTPKGCLGKNQATVIPTTNIPVVINDDSVAIMVQSDNGVLEDTVFSTISDDIFEKFSVIPNKENIKTHTHSYYIYFYWTAPNSSQTEIWALDCRNTDWFKWTLPIKVKYMYESDTTLDNATETETRVVTDTDEYTLTSILHYKEGNDDTEFNEDIETYQDYLGKSKYSRIPWKWKSRIQTLGTINYLKKITSLQLIFSDNSRTLSANDILNNKTIKNNAMFYTIKTYRKKSKLLNGSFTGQLDGVGTQRIKLRLPKCDFAELTLSNYNKSTTNIDVINMFAGDALITIDGDSENPWESDGFSNVYGVYDRLHLVGITFKILLSEGLNG